MKTKFRNKNGDLSLYALACGYVQRVTENNIKKYLFVEHSHFHVKKYKVVNGNSELIEWNTYGLLTPARQDFNSL